MNKKDGYPKQEMAAKVFPMTWVWVSFFVFMFITWFSWIKYGIVRALSDKTVQESTE